MGLVSDVEPKEVLGYFEQICKIARPSGNEKAISDYLVDFAKEQGLAYVQDDAFNVIIYKDASKGYEDYETTIIQAHIDMVCVHNDTAQQIPEENGVIAYIDGDYIKAKGTTLGADDGIGVAFAMATLASQSMEHPAIEAVFTTSEETGLYGAKALDVTKLKGRRMINVDTEEEGNLVIGCAGGCRSSIVFKNHSDKINGERIEVKISGCVGGHSGVEIYKESANANVLMGRLLYELRQQTDYGLVSIMGGTKDNAICDLSVANIIVGENKLELIKEFISEYDKQIGSEYHVTDPDIKATMSELGKSEEMVIDSKDVDRILTVLNVAPAGIVKHRQADMKYVETSLNMGIVRVDTTQTEICHCLRSNIDAGRERLKYVLDMLAKSVGAEFIVEGEYPAWENECVSEYAQNASDLYEKMYGRQLKVFTEHAGLECALFYSKMKDLDAISIGPDIVGAHTTEEAVSISSIQREWKFFVQLLKVK